MTVGVVLGGKLPKYLEMKKVIAILVGTMLASSLAMAAGTVGRYPYKDGISHDAQMDEFVQCRRHAGLNVALEVFGGGLVGMAMPLQDPHVQQKVHDCMTGKGYKLLTDSEVEDLCMIEQGSNTRLSKRLCIFLW